MWKYRALVAGVAGVLFLAGPAWADGTAKGSAPTARAMLERAVAVIKTNEAKALADFKGGADGFFKTRARRARWRPFIYKGSGLTSDEATLDHYLTSPKGVVSKTIMPLPA